MNVLPRVPLYTMLVPYIPHSVVPYCLVSICFMTSIATSGMHRRLIHHHVVRIVTGTKHHRQLMGEQVRERLRKGEFVEG